MLNEVPGPEHAVAPEPAREPAMPVLVVAAALLDRNGRVLMQRRPFGKQHGGLWEFPGGKVEPGEAPAAALARELCEELALDVEPANAFPLSFAGEGHLLLLLYLCERWTGEPQAMEASEICWVPASALRDLAMPPLDYPLAEALRQRLEARAGIEPACKDLQSSA